MELLEGLLDPEYLKKVLSMAAQAQLTEYLIVIGIVWKVMGSKVASHFSSLERALNGVSSEIVKLREAVSADLRAQSSRLENVENNVIDLRSRIKNLEEKKH